MELDIQYFKSSGKWYASDTLNLLPEELFYVDGETYADMNKIGDRVIQLSKSKHLPGLTPCNWLEEGYIYINAENIGYPRLLMKEHLIEKVYIPLKTYEDY